MLETRRLRLCAPGARGRLLLDALDWQARAGEFWCVIGRNGAGKSTLLRRLAGLDPEGRRSNDGAVLVDGRPPAQWPPPELARRRAFLPQFRVDAFGYTALDTVLMARHAHMAGQAWETAVDHAAARAALVTMDADRFAGRDVRMLSGGERQRVALAAVLAQQAPLLLLDEPAAALDLAHQVRLMRHLSMLCRERGGTAVMTGHDLNLARDAATHALLLMDGGGWLAGPVADAMRPDALTRCLGHPVDMVVHGGRTLFVPQVDTRNDPA